jgi:hypothetical protein
MTGSFGVAVARYPEVKIETTPEGTPWTEDMESDAPPEADKPDENDLPKKYADPETSGLTATVVKGDNNVVNFELSSK